MELRFPAPSSDNAPPLDNSTPGKAPASPEASAIKDVAESKAATPFRRVPDGPTITSVAPAYPVIKSPRNGDSPSMRKDTKADGNVWSNAATSVTTFPNSSTLNPASDPSTATPSSSVPTPRSPKLRPRRRQRVQLRHLLPAWSVSLLVHVVILSALAAATFSAQGRNKKPVSFNSALAGYRQGELEELNIWADPATIPRDQAIGKEHGGASAEPVVEMSGEVGSESDDDGGTVVAATFGSEAPSAMPRFRGTGKRGINEGNSLPNFKIEGLGGSPLNTLSPTPAADLYGGGRIAGDPIFPVQEIGTALDQLAREILRHLKEHKLTVVWLFDESISMQDDQRTILEKFDRVSAELNNNIEPGKKTSGALNHAIVGFGQGFDFVLKKPTPEIDEIGRAIKRLRTDMSGAENTMQAIIHTVDTYAGLIGKDRKMLLILVTDESGDDGGYIEEARQALKKYKVPLYVIGRQSLFGYQFAHHRYVDAVTKDVYHPLINRGPETADVEIYQWDGLYDRWDEQPSGFAPWELARLTKDSGGIYFLLPSEEFMRVRQREQAYSIVQLREYMPEYDNRLIYFEKRTASELRRSIYQIIAETKSLTYRREFPIDPSELVQIAKLEGTNATQKLDLLLNVQSHLEKLKNLRDRDRERRWQAHYDLMLAQTVAFQVKAFEYRALMAQIIQKPPLPGKQPTPDLAITWVVDHAKEPLAAKDLTAKKYAEAKQLLEGVITKHPKTPWADLAQDTLDRGFSVKLNEWHHNPKYAERAQFVPKY
jgi:von Willebrand factor type A domain